MSHFWRKFSAFTCGNVAFLAQLAQLLAEIGAFLAQLAHLLAENVAFLAQLAQLLAEIGAITCGNWRIYLRKLSHFLRKFGAFFAQVWRNWRIYLRKMSHFWRNWRNYLRKLAQLAHLLAENVAFLAPIATRKCAKLAAIGAISAKNEN